MQRSIRYRQACRSMPVLLAGLACVLHARAVDLNRLDACADVAATLALLKHPDDVVCSAARNVVERALVARIDPAGVLQPCFLKAPPKAYTNFSCLRTTWETQQNLFCFRASSTAELTDYVENYPSKYARQVKTYLEAAAACPVANGDAAAASYWTAPFALHAIARFEFGYNLGLGKSNPAMASMMHGFARLDPTLSGAGVDALEFVSMSTGGNSGESVNRRKASRKREAGDWIVYLDEGIDVEMFKTHGMNVNAVFRGIDVERMTKPARPQDEKEATLASWQKVAVADFADERFERLSTIYLKKETGFDITNVVAQFEERMPYGWRGRNAIRVAPNFAVFSATRSQRCVEKGGAILALVMGLLPTMNVNANYGSIMFGVIGVGACGAPVRATQNYFDQLIDETMEDIIHHIERTP